MPPKLALALAVGFIVWLFRMERKAGGGFSTYTLWVPLIWLCILGSRPLSLWFDINFDQNYALDGSPIDRLNFLCLIIIGLVILGKRGMNWSAFISQNPWLSIFFFYLLLSVLWSPFPFISFKRWIKDFGNIVMMLVILQEVDPKAACRSVLTRMAFILVPLSVVAIKYFPETGRSYNPWTWTYIYSGLSPNKNMLGATLVICSLALFWDFLELRKAKKTTKPQLILGAMAVWLFLKADSSTSVVCLVLGIVILLGFRSQKIRSFGMRPLAYGAVFVGLLVFAHFVFNVGELFTQGVGRDTTLTGRTAIWTRVLKDAGNPLIGTGYYSYWLASQIDWVAEGWASVLNEAHNGYLETYLNSGLIGVILLVGMLLSNTTLASRRAALGGDYEALKFAFLLIAITYNFTESAFNRMSPIWILALFAIARYPRRATAPKVQLPEFSSEPTFATPRAAAWMRQV